MRYSLKVPPRRGNVIVIPQTTPHPTPPAEPPRKFLAELSPGAIVIAIIGLLLSVVGSLVSYQMSQSREERKTDREEAKADREVSKATNEKLGVVSEKLAIVITKLEAKDVKDAEQDRRLDKHAAQILDLIESVHRTQRAK